MKTKVILFGVLVAAIAGVMTMTTTTTMIAYGWFPTSWFLPKGGGTGGSSGGSNSGCAGNAGCAGGGNAGNAG